MIDCATLKTTSTGKNPRPGKTLGSAAHAPRNTQVVPLTLKYSGTILSIAIRESKASTRYAIVGHEGEQLHFTLSVGDEQYSIWSAAVRQTSFDFIGRPC